MCHPILERGFGVVEPAYKEGVDVLAEFGCDFARVLRHGFLDGIDMLDPQRCQRRDTNACERQKGEHCLVAFLTRRRVRLQSQRLLGLIHTRCRSCRCCTGYGLVAPGQIEVVGIRCLDPASKSFLLRQPKDKLTRDGQDRFPGGLSQRHSGYAHRHFEMCAKFQSHATQVEF